MAKPDHDTIRTRASLLGRLKDWNDQTSWQVFYCTYRQLIHNFAVKQGLNESQAQDVVQETLLAVAKAIRDFEYDPARSSFKNWLLTVTRHRIADHFRRQLREPASHRPLDAESTRTPTVERVADPHGQAIEGLWEAEWRQNATDLALERLKAQVSSKHFQVFYLLVIKQQPAASVAKALGVTRAQVYLVKHRVGPVFKKALAAVERELG